MLLDASFRASRSLPHHQLHLISSQTGGLESLGFIFTLAVITPAPLCSCLHSRNHTLITSAKCFLYVCTHRWEWVCGWAGVVEGKERNTFLEATITSHREDNELLGGSRLVRTGRASRCSQSRSAFASA